jgi:FKBP-type peptidyl-prolyl cis-trans isomerase
MTKYTFKTIVAPEAVRAEFTALRDQLNSSDKELMQAFWNIGVDRLDDIKKEVEMLQASTAQARAEKQEIKAAAKLKKAPKAKKEKKVTKVAAKKAPKKKAEKASKVTKVVDDEDGLECVVVDATR